MLRGRGGGGEGLSLGLGLFDLAHGFCAHTGRKIGGGCAFSEPIGQPGQGALKVGARDVLHEVNGAAAPCWAMWSNHFPSFGPWASDVEPVSLPAVRLRFVLLEAQGVKTSGSGNARILSAVAFCCTSAFSARSRFRRSLSAVASAAFLAVRSLSAVRAHGRRTGRLVGRWPRPAHRPICRGSARRAAAPQSQA